MRDNKRSQMKYERYEKEREAKLLAKEKIKILQKELNIANMERRKLSDQMVKAYQEISRLKNFENENKSLKKDKTELLEELQKSSKENHKLQKKLIKLYENSHNTPIESNLDSDLESPIINESQMLGHSRIFSNSRGSLVDFNLNKSNDYYEDEPSLINSKSMMLDTKGIDKSKYLTNSNTRLNETMVSYDRGVNRFQKKILIEKDKEIDDKNREIDEISRKYEDKLRDLNKSRNEERDKYEKKLKSFGRSFKTLTSKRKQRYLTGRVKTPVP